MGTRLTLFRGIGAQSESEKAAQACPLEQRCRKAAVLVGDTAQPHTGGRERAQRGLDTRIELAALEQRLPVEPSEQCDCRRALRRMRRLLAQAFRQGAMHELLDTSAHEGPDCRWRQLAR